MTNHEEKYKALALTSLLNSSSSHFNGDSLNCELHRLDNIRLELISEATHKSQCGCYFYKATRKAKPGFIARLFGMTHNIEIYDQFNVKWDECDLFIEELIELK